MSHYPNTDDTMIMLPPVKRVQIVVDYLNGQMRFYQVPDSGWKIDSLHRCIIIGKDLPRTHIPLDTVASFHIEETGK